MQYIPVVKLSIAQQFFRDIRFLWLCLYNLYYSKIHIREESYKQRPFRDAPDRMNCSETVDRMFAAAGIDLVPEALGKVTPGKLAKSKYLLKVGSNTA
ncbi:hypothetical protein P4S83_00230 [Aneurinibacillus thermoaerophilus]|uniref:hypothetical protein n=1 Tax=Aneurinibacillus thermoaerophilus TaxID=143495 RepID=UPI002E245B01|nr:hypothetical protein [Aneurinibacillus thermoaerophilus]MED0766123.1 hypothetical protein [Aneurinibacillus thermoaerophilus]